MNFVRKKSPVANPDSVARTRDFVLSDARVDSYGDTIDQNGWILDDFKSNPIALFNHNPDTPIGSWANIRTIGGQLKAVFQPAYGMSTRIDEILRLVDAGVLKATSVGFIAEEAERFGKGMRYLKSRLKETSIVSIPANAGALAIEAKRLRISDQTIRLLSTQPEYTHTTPPQPANVRTRTQYLDPEAHLPWQEIARREMVRMRSREIRRQIDFTQGLTVGTKIAEMNNTGENAVEAAQEFMRRSIEQFGTQTMEDLYRQAEVDRQFRDFYKLRE